MTYIIAEPCIDIKDLSCVDVCPVDCIHEFERILIIDPEECIDCFAPDEQLLTTYGPRTFAELENQPCRVLTDGGFKPALVKRFRRKPFVKLELAPAFEERDRYGGWRLTTRNVSRSRRTIWATPTHSWPLADGDRTDSLTVGDFVPVDAAPAEARERELPTWCAARSCVRGRRLEQAGDSFGRASALRPALRRQGGSVQGLLRPGQLLPVPRRASRLRLHGLWRRRASISSVRSRRRPTSSTSPASWTAGLPPTGTRSRPDRGGCDRPTMKRSSGSRP